MPLDAARRRAPRRAFTPDPSLRRDIAQEITDQIIALLEAGGELPWRKPWTCAGGGLPLRHDGTPYRGINVFLLGLRAMAQGHASPYWMSYNQAVQLGGQVRKGEKSTTVVYYGVARDKRADDAGDRAGRSGVDGDNGGEDGGAYRFLKHFAAFNADQVDGLPARYHPERDLDEDAGARPIAALQEITDAMRDGLGVGFQSGGDRACYIRALDAIHMPKIRRFHDAEKYYAVMIHEMAHATEHPKRLAIDYGDKCFGNEAYALGELYAELVASLLGAHLCFAPTHIEDHAAYVQSWLKVLRGDKRFILKAAADAQRGADYLLQAAQDCKAAP
ncbi:ArdC family protein [Rubrimonas cliftonensis]|uniref:Antirestriction protein ArdC n=1 Tax=Rubrimonas cliftonensis TaxID=89524 RepID=A0A1H4ERA3_9RHOB|nr:zincin-like metallopeptidase domain-containing protein [Rubrimonas cliftonensis]SEA87624.1 Antirestriction protein ArdC [Rubrimonas cliftonensis]